MDSFELNKIIGAFLGVVFVVFTVSLVSDALFHAPAPETPGYAIAVPEEGEGQDQGGEEAPQSVLPLLASADASAGANVFKRCQACHTAEEGGPNKVGPNLWDIVNRPVAGHEGFSYSSALQEFAQGGEVVWDYEHLDHFLESPKGLVPGTAMAFAGLKKIEDRADLIAYLRSLSDSPAPLPEVAEESTDEGAAQEAAPAVGGAQAAPMENGAADGEPAAQEGDGATDQGAEDGGAGQDATVPASEAQAPDAEEQAPAGDGQ
ncbi:c-type cytochrome [Chelativorans intermedius]|uniref:C-type cytochrome n=1 Tax=Chelativorans intermedius TaxID=515947 RepID=A0ABV6D6H9_9HYPH|nr:c-type cytochrome [Chelativorans intermedius]MCT8998284.1 c-type cytochrome [Chelativorans intermedius]